MNPIPSWRTSGLVPCHLRKSIVPPNRWPISQKATAAIIVGMSSSLRARKNPSKRKPRSRKLSFRTACENIMRPKARVTGIAMMSLLKPAADTINHSAITAEEITEATSQTASAGSLMKAAPVDSVTLKIDLLPSKLSLTSKQCRQPENATACQSFAAYVELKKRRHKPCRLLLRVHRRKGVAFGRQS